MAQLLTTYSGSLTEAGCDEAGRGPLAGPVYAAAVVLPEGFNHPLLNDSKQMTEKQRDLLREVIESRAVSWAVVAVSPQEIDSMDILRCSILGMHRALDLLTTDFQMVLVDGNKFFPYAPHRSAADPFFTPRKAAVSKGKSGYVSSAEADPVRGTTAHRCIVKGDGKYTAIAAASVLAKTHRDEYMRRIAREYPMYGWDVNMGYPTAEHREAIARYGVSPYHRKSFRLLPDAELF